MAKGPGRNVEASVRDRLAGSGETDSYAHSIALTSLNPGDLALARMTRDGAVGFLSAHLQGFWAAKPDAVWLLLGKGGRLQNFKLPIRIFRTEGQALWGSVVTFELDGVSVPVTTPEKAVSDILRWRDEIGCALAEEVLAAYLASAFG